MQFKRIYIHLFINKLIKKTLKYKNNSLSLFECHSMKDSLTIKKINKCQFY